MWAAAGGRHAHYRVASAPTEARPESVPVAACTPPTEATFIAFDRAGLESAAAAEGAVAAMVGDVNVFLLDDGDEADEYRDAAAAADGGSGGGATTVDAAATVDSRGLCPPVAELMVMIAEPGARRRGFAGEAVTLMMHWGACAAPRTRTDGWTDESADVVRIKGWTRNTALTRYEPTQHLPCPRSAASATLGVTTFVAKISDGNAPSLRLFQSLGFVVAKAVPAFGETHVVRRFGVRNGGGPRDVNATRGGGTGAVADDDGALRIVMEAAEDE